MRRVEAIIKPHKLDAVSRALHHTPGVGGVTVTEVRGFGRGKLQEEHAHPATQAFEFEPHLKVELVCQSAAAEDIAGAIRDAARTGLAGDGIILISSVDDAIRIRTSTRGDEAL
jgi:nitrogen regulatory protein P-II 1